MNLINHIIEPTRLLLAWQQHGTEKRRRFIVAELLKNSDGLIQLNYLEESRDFLQARELGFTNYPGFAVGESHLDTLHIFMKRLPPRKRTDFGRFLTSIRIPEDATISDFALLGYSGARLPDDGFVFINPFENAKPPFELMTPIAGYYYHKDKAPKHSLAEGMSVELKKEPDNPKDSNAVAIWINGIQAGYINKGLPRSVNQWLDNGWVESTVIERLNGTPKNPRVLIFLKMRDEKSELSK